MLYGKLHPEQLKAPPIICNPRVKFGGFPFLAHKMRSHRYSQLGSLSRSLLQHTSHVRLRECKISRSASYWTTCQNSYSQSICFNQHRVHSWLNSASFKYLPRHFIHTATPSSLLSSRRGTTTNLEDARQFVASLTSSQRSTLETAMQELKTKEDVTTSQEAPTWNQLKLCMWFHLYCECLTILTYLLVVCYQHALPFIGFGFLDNVIMITVVGLNEGWA